MNYHAEALTLGLEAEAVLQSLSVKSRDNARTPMQWEDRSHAGFTQGIPWLPANPNYVFVNARAAVNDPDSVFHHYKALIELRHTTPVVVDGRFALLLADHDQLWAFTRTLGRRHPAGAGQPVDGAARAARRRAARPRPGPPCCSAPTAVTARATPSRPGSRGSSAWPDPRQRREAGQSPPPSDSRWLQLPRSRAGWVDGVQPVDQGGRPPRVPPRAGGGRHRGSPRAGARPARTAIGGSHRRSAGTRRSATHVDGQHRHRHANSERPTIGPYPRSEAGPGRTSADTPERSADSARARNACR